MAGRNTESSPHYDAPAGSNGGLPDTPNPASVRTLRENQRMGSAGGRAAPAIPYAAPGSSSGSINPASTFAFIMNMGYAPPDMDLEPLRRLVEQMTEGPNGEG